MRKGKIKIKKAKISQKKMTKQIGEIVKKFSNQFKIMEENKFKMKTNCNNNKISKTKMMMNRLMDIKKMMKSKIDRLMQNNKVIKMRMSRMVLIKWKINHKNQMK